MKDFSANLHGTPQRCTTVKPSLTHSPNELGLSISEDPNLLAERIISSHLSHLLESGSDEDLRNVLKCLLEKLPRLGLSYQHNDLESRMIKNLKNVFVQTSRRRSLSTVQDRKFLLSCLVDKSIDRAAVAKTFGTKTKTVQDAVCLRKTWNSIHPQHPGFRDTQTLKITTLYQKQDVFPQSVTNSIITYIEELTHHDPSTCSSVSEWYDPRLGSTRIHEGRWTSMHKNELGRLILSRFGERLFLDGNGIRILTKEGKKLISRRKDGVYNEPSLSFVLKCISTIPWLASNPYGTYFGCPICLEFKKNYSTLRSFAINLLENFNCPNREYNYGNEFVLNQYKPIYSKLCTCNSCKEILNPLPESSTEFTFSQLCEFKTVPDRKCFTGQCLKCPKLILT